MPIAQTTQPTVRELLHVRFKYQIAHIADAGSLTGPIPTASLAAQRNAHLGRLRADSGRADYGEPMPDLAASAA